MTAVARRRRPLGALAVLALLCVGPSTGSSAASATNTDPVTEPAWAQMTVSVQAHLSPAASEEPYDAAVTLDYILTNTGRVPIRQVTLEDPLVPGGHVSCGGSSVIRVLPLDSPVACSASVELPPGTYTSRPRALGWYYVLIVGLPVTASARATFTVPAPPPPSSPPPASPTPSPPPPPPPTPPVSAAPPPPPAPSQSPVTPPSPARTRAPAVAPTTPPPSKTPAATVAPSPRRVVPSLPAPRPVAVPDVPASQVRQLPTHVTVLLLFLPAAVGAAVAGAAAARRR